MLLEWTRPSRIVASIVGGERRMHHALAEPIQRAAADAIPLDGERAPRAAAQKVGEEEVRAGEQLIATGARQHDPRADHARARGHHAAEHLEGVGEGKIALRCFGRRVRGDERHVGDLAPRHRRAVPLGQRKDCLVLAPAIAHGIAHGDERELARRRTTAEGARAAGEDRARVPPATQPERGDPTSRHPLVDGVRKQGAELFRTLLE